MRSLRAALAASLAALALLAGCSDDDPSPGDPGSTSTPTDKPETPTSSATAKPTEPALPDAATKATEAGARAFITYYWDLINYAQVTGDVKALKRVSASSCEGCNAGIEGVREHYQSGGRVIGGAHRIAIKSLSELSTSSGNAFGFHGVVRASHDDQTIISSDGSEDVRGPGTDTFDVYLLWLEKAGWRLDVMEVR
ncbi:hypothetical protein CFH99_14585 [Nocardioides aromaticivorans]|uniref:DUF6318 domain-containing protein n=1 Tax=Nocardioides aromaticivorans TaxID=200618 RepID=A0ABX7PLI5_9ACTN|nr:DUF6318 family protein [Nocardioides aromaticivorans]QSR26854.1 hypothetical protein CFH99_14585 [Nocardioides aromaticivorans]